MRAYTLRLDALLRTLVGAMRTGDGRLRLRMPAQPLRTLVGAMRTTATPDTEGEEPRLRTLVGAMRTRGRTGGPIDPVALRTLVGAMRTGTPGPLTWA